MAPQGLLRPGTWELTAAEGHNVEDPFTVVGCDSLAETPAVVGLLLWYEAVLVECS